MIIFLCVIGIIASLAGYVMYRLHENADMFDGWED